MMTWTIDSTKTLFSSPDPRCAAASGSSVDTGDVAGTEFGFRGSDIEVIINPTTSKTATTAAGTVMRGLDEETADHQRRIGESDLGACPDPAIGIIVRR